MRKIKSYSILIPEKCFTVVIEQSIKAVDCYIQRYNNRLNQLSYLLRFYWIQ